MMIEQESAGKSSCCNVAAKRFWIQDGYSAPCITDVCTKCNSTCEIYKPAPAALIRPSKKWNCIAVSCPSCDAKVDARCKPLGPPYKVRSKKTAVDNPHVTRVNKYRRAVLEKNSARRAADQNWDVFINYREGRG